MEKPEGKLLIIDDDKDVLESLNMFLKYEFAKVITTRNPNRIHELIKTENIDVILLDMNFVAGIQTGNEGIFWLREIRQMDPALVVILITAYGDIQLAVKAIKEGATDFIIKPWDNDKLVSTLKAAYQLRKTKLEVRNLKQKQQKLHADINRQFKIIWGSSLHMRKVYETVRKVAPTDANVLITGENGTGKELVAREIHRLSNRNHEAFINVDLGALHENLFESELFGHVKGAFTDAREDRAGRFEIANGGTLFLDEIGNLPLFLQSKILTAIQNKVITRLGSNHALQLDVRLISATNKNLHNMISENLFREDLLYRIQTLQIEIPPLRKRPEDIGQLANHFLQEFVLKYEKPYLRMNQNAIDKLEQHSWPGNVRELKHTIEKAVILCDSKIISARDFMFTYEPASITSGKMLRLSEVEKNTIIEALNINKMNLSETARKLGISRPTLYKKIKKYSISL
ncbi:MAG: sigma-54-dependent Fis family transcriptional regulator [Bacteroidales bacterium]|nr:sigma-54-dependent Fis family transcriptional regulator [Bacteroidales bacterium]